VLAASQTPQTRTVSPLQVQPTVPAAPPLAPEQPR
jgi:hypothetical protein